MTAQEWRDKSRAAAVVDAETLTLPTGMTIKARRPDPMQLAAWDRLPFSLAAAVAGEAAPAGDGLSADQVVATAEFMRELLVTCVVEPRISMEPKDDSEIHPREIQQKDWLYIVAWALRVPEVDATRRFRGGSGTGRGVRDGKDVGVPAERAAGDRGPGDGAGGGLRGDGTDAQGEGGGDVGN